MTEVKTIEALKLSKALRALEEANAALEATDAQRRKVTAELLRAQAALEELGKERNTWARQMADIRGERDEANKVAEKALEMLASVSNDRDRLCVEMGDLADSYLAHRQATFIGSSVAKDINVVIDQWEAQ